MAICEINFDGLVGPSHNYAGLSLGNLASSRNAGGTSFPRKAALQGLAKMRSNIALGLVQGLFVPLPRPAVPWLEALGTNMGLADRVVAANAMSASSMWAANAATVSPAPDTADGRCHLTVANLKTMSHRSLEWADTLKQLQLVFANAAFAVHEPVPTAFGDEGAANHMRLAAGHGASGVELFVYGLGGGPFPARQHLEASRAVARLHRLDPERTYFAQQSEEAIAAGAFHNDVVAVANERILFAHEKAFADPHSVKGWCAARIEDLDYVEVADADVPLAEAIKSYLFNAQLVTPPDGQMTLVAPTECRDTPSVKAWIDRHIAGNGAIRRVEYVDVRQSMANGGGPACLRLRVQCDPADVDSRFLMTPETIGRVEQVVERLWPEQLDPEALQSRSVLAAVGAARAGLIDALGMPELA